MPFGPLFMKDVLFQVAAVDYAKELSSVLFETSSDQVEWKGLKPDSKYTEATPPSYTCTVKYAQDWDSADSFSRWLYVNNGKTAEVTFKPKATSLPSFTATLQIVAGPIGGDVDSFAESTVQFGSSFPDLDDGDTGGGSGTAAAARSDDALLVDVAEPDTDTEPSEPVDTDTESAEEDSDAALVP